MVDNGGNLGESPLDGRNFGREGGEPDPGLPTKKKFFSLQLVTVVAPSFAVTGELAMGPKGLLLDFNPGSRRD